MSNLTQKPTLTGILSNESVKKRFDEMLGKKSAGFISSIISATKGNPKLANCEPNSIVSSAVIAATLDLPIQSNLGFAAIVPYTTKVDGQFVDVAQFQIMWRGLVQLAIRSGQYRTINTSEVYEGELVKYSRVTGECEIDESQKKSEKIVGYVAYFKLVTGFEKYLYMSREEVEKHALKYSQTYKKGFGKWKDDFDSMAKKTVLKLLLSKFGILSVDIQNALTFDQSVVMNPETMETVYADNTEEQVTVEIDHEADRVSMMVNDCETKEQLKALKKEVDSKYHDLFTNKEVQLGGK